MSENNVIQDVCSLKTVVDIGVGQVILQLEGCSSIDMLYSRKEDFLNALQKANFDIQSVVTTIIENE